MRIKPHPSQPRGMKRFMTDEYPHCAYQGVLQELGEDSLFVINFLPFMHKNSANFYDFEDDVFFNPAPPSGVTAFLFKTCNPQNS